MKKLIEQDVISKLNEIENDLASELENSSSVEVPTSLTGCSGCSGTQMCAV